MKHARSGAPNSAGVPRDRRGYFGQLPSMCSSKVTLVASGRDLKVQNKIPAHFELCPSLLTASCLLARSEYGLLSPGHGLLDWRVLMRRNQRAIPQTTNTHFNEFANNCVASETVPRRSTSRKKIVNSFPETKNNADLGTEARRMVRRSQEGTNFLWVTHPSRLCETGHITHLSAPHSPSLAPTKLYEEENQ